MGRLQPTTDNYWQQNIKPEKSPLSTPARVSRARERAPRADHTKLQALAKEILNVGRAVVAFVKNPELPPTNNEAERALRLAGFSGH